MFCGVLVRLRERVEERIVGIKLVGKLEALTRNGERLSVNKYSFLYSALRPYSCS